MELGQLMRIVSKTTRFSRDQLLDLELKGNTYFMTDSTAYLCDGKFPNTATGGCWKIQPLL